MKKTISKILLTTCLLVLFPQVTLAAGTKVSINPSPQTLNEGGPSVEFTLQLDEPIIAPEEVENPTVDVYLSYENGADEGRLNFSQDVFEIAADDWANIVTFSISAVDDSYLNLTDSVDITVELESESEYYDGYTTTLEILIEDDETEDQVYVEIESPSEDEILTSGTFEVTGYSIPEYIVTVYADEYELGATVVGEDGGWSVEVEDFNYNNGDYVLTATAKEAIHYAFMTNVDKIDVVNIELRVLVETIDTHGVFDISDVIYDPVNNYAYAIAVNLANTKNYILKINGYTFAIEETLSLSDSMSSATYGLAIDDNGEYLYALHALEFEGPETYVSKIALESFEISDELSVNLLGVEASSGIAVNNATGTLWVKSDGGVLVYDLDEFILIAIVNLSEETLGSGNIVFSADGSTAYIPDPEVDSLFIVDTESLTTQSIAGLDGIIMVAITPDESKLFGVSPQDSLIYAVDLVDNVLIDSTIADRPPESIGITQDGLSWVVGDDHDSGYIYFGFVSMNSNTLDVLVNPDGGSYTTISSNFVTDHSVSAEVNVNINLPTASRSTAGSRVNKVEKELTYTEEIAAMLKAGIVTENPEGLTNKCEALVMMARVFDWNVGTDTNDIYTDTPEWCGAYAKFGTERGIVEGRTPTTLGMETPVTRYEVATMLYRELKEQNFKFGDFSHIKFAGFLDLPLISWAEDAVMTLYKESIIKGFSDGSFRGEKGILKQDFAVMLLRIFY